MKADDTSFRRFEQHLRHFTWKSGGPGPWLLAVVMLVGAAFAGPVRAQGLSPYVFGINYTQGGLSAGKTNDLKKAGMKIIRLGGNERNHDIKWRNKYDWVNDIEYVKYTLNAEPIIQLPIGLPTSEVSDWVYFFNVTKGYNIKFWTIGNEPDPGDNLDALKAWLNGTVFYQTSNNGLPNDFNYSQWETRFINLANALKAYDGTAKIVGPDFRLFYTEAVNLEYARFLTNVGHRACSSNANVPLLDYFGFHFYPSTTKTESDLEAPFNALQALLNQANSQRSWADLRMAVTELNGEKTGSYLPWWFNTGQFVATMTKLALAHDAFCITPWSVFEHSGDRTGTDFSFYNPDDSRRSTMHHFALLSENRRANYMPSTQANYANQIVALGMRETGTSNAGYTIMLMNTTSSTRSFNISLNGSYQGSSSSAQVKFSGYANVTNTPLTGSIAPTTTLLFRCDANGNFISKQIYSQGEPGPHFRTALATADAADAIETLRVFPNPAASILTIELGQDATQATLRDLTGRVCRTQLLTGRAGQLNIEELPAGVYLLSVRTAQGEVTQKVVKE
ncbi:MAG: T9SS type A sorting domain-containing protein [Bacteroidota bacterium]|nr:T9SS type A sorting domain-containing protein [Bacteroidota bacterium]